MNDNIKSLLIFVSGLGIGAFVSWRILEEKYKAIAQEEIDSVKEVYSYKKPEEPKPDGLKTVPKPSLEEMKAKLDTKVDELKVYSETVEDLGYTNRKEGGESMANSEKPYVISPDEFGELNDYDTMSLTYYKDDVVTDEFDRPLSGEDVERMIGKESLTHFGEYEDDSVFVRNDILKTDYEILLDERNYYDTNNTRQDDK